MDSLIAFENALHAAGMRVTTPRKAILHFVQTSFQHPTARQIHDSLKSVHPTLSLATVYNTLEVLVANGLAYDLGTAFDGEVHYDGQTSPHINLVCTSCHQIYDCPLDIFTESAANSVATTGFKVSGTRIVYYGCCKACLINLQK
jgi:Fur family peroxide stress response transcriptional regulator